MDLHEALYTTRAMRRVRPDPIPLDLQARIIDAAIRAPSGGNTQGWRFLLVDDPQLRADLAPIYRDCLDQLWAGFYAERIAAAEADPDSVEGRQMRLIKASSDHLADHFAEVPLLLFGFVQHDPTGGSIFPAIWSAQLAARAEGVGSSLTSVLQFRKRDVLTLLGVPAEEGWLMSCCVTFGYPTGRWGVAARRPVHEVSFRNRWGTEVGFRVDRPLWPATDG